VLVAASTSCFPKLSLQEAFDRLADLEYTAAEIVVREGSGALTPTELAPRFDSIVHTCRMSRRINPVAFYFDVEPNLPNYNDYFATCCQLAKACRIVVMTIHASPKGTPFNEEVERLKTLVRIGVNEGVIVGVLTEADCISGEPDAIVSLSKNVSGLAAALDPSHFIYNEPKMKDFDSIIDLVHHVRLRDTTKDAFQVQIGQGSLEYGRLAIQLEKAHYNRALCVDLAELPNVEPIAELRKMRLLLESLL